MLVLRGSLRDRRVHLSGRSFGIQPPLHCPIDASTPFYELSATMVSLQMRVQRRYVCDRSQPRQHNVQERETGIPQNAVRLMYVNAGGQVKQLEDGMTCASCENACLLRCFAERDFLVCRQLPLGDSVLLANAEFRVQRSRVRQEPAVLPRRDQRECGATGQRRSCCSDGCTLSAVLIVNAVLDLFDVQA